MTLPRKALFLDRDGVICDLLPAENGELRPPRQVDELTISSGLVTLLDWARIHHVIVFGVTNQPDISRGVTTLHDQNQINDEIIKRHSDIAEIEMCIHDNAANCECRKPSPGMILKLAKKYNVNLPESITIGDRWVDIAAGNRASTKTVLLDRPYSWAATSQGGAPIELTPDFRVNELGDIRFLVI